jgi:hypothetical protein
MALLLALCNDSHSQQPSPSPTIESQPPQSQTTQSSTENQRGTESAPFIVKIIPPSQAEQKSGLEQSK